MSVHLPIKNEISSVSYVEELIKENSKNFLKIIRHSFEWTLIFFPNLESNSINNLVTFVKTGENAFVFPSIGQSFCKISDSLNSHISKLRKHLFDLIWNFFKLCKSLKNNNILKFGNKIFFSRLEIIANVCSSFNSIEAIFFEGKQLFKFTFESNQNSLDKNSISLDDKIDNDSRVPDDVKVLRRLWKITDQIGKLALGILFFASLFIATTKFFLPIETIILISNIVDVTLEKIYIEPIKEEEKKIKT
ncbi:MAG: hypothetical protein K940chlam5_01097 [Candidatus Anoxychlamydiales bacterium]|nr:hypothetical protein [Candidatus Anoxychlamydiales bacterium]